MRHAVLFLAALIAGTGIAHAQAAPIDGMWINPAKSVIIKIGPCGDDRCGTVEWASAAAEADARKNVPQLIGSALLTGLVPDGDAWKGQIYVADRNITASAKVAPVGADKLKVSGCALGGLICDTQVWNKTDQAQP